MLGEGNVTPLQYSCLENPMDGGAWKLQSMESLRVGHNWATSLSIFTFHFHALEKEMATHSSVLAWRILSITVLACAAAAAAKSRQSCLTLCNPIDGLLPGSPVPGILQARTLEWVAISLSNAWKWKVKIESEGAQSCPTLSDPIDCSLPGSSVHGIFQARVLEWGAIAFSEI